jgi:hypothetical protein
LSRPGPAVHPIDPSAVAGALAALIDRRAGIVRVAVDGPAAAEPHTVAATLVAPLQTRGRPAVLIPADGFWHDASLRFEHGREDPDAFLSWLDARALRREVLDPVVRTGRYLPSLRDPATNRSTREPIRTVTPGTIVLVSGELLLGLGLPFDVTVHLALSAAALARRSPADRAWTLPAFARYDDEVHPAAIADVVLRLDDPRHPAVTGLLP